MPDDSGGGNISDLHRLYRPFGNLDTLITCVYWYCVRRGFWCVCSAHLTYVLTIGFTTLYAPLLLLYVDWMHLTHCPDTSECVPFRYMGGEYTVAGWMGIGLFVSMCSVFFVWNLVHCALAIRRSHAIRQLLQSVDCSDISCDWGVVCDRIATVAEELRIPELRRRLTVSDINQRITRYDSFMCALIHQSLLDCPMTPVRFRQSCLTRSLEWCISRCIFAELVHADGTLNVVFVHASNRLGQRLRVMGCIMVVVSPFLFVFIALYHFFKYAEHVYKNPVYMASRRWSPYARLRMRAYGELPHELSNRVTLAYRDVDLFIGKHPHHLPWIWGRFVSFILGSVVGTILAMSYLSERALLFRLGDHDLLWMLAVLSSLILLVRSSTEIPRVSREAVGVNVATLQSHMTNIPRRWQSCADKQIANDLQRLCPPVALFFAHELLGILTTPLYLYFSISHRAADIAAFIQDHSTTIENVGFVCQPQCDAWDTI